MRQTVLVLVLCVGCFTVAFSQAPPESAVKPVLSQDHRQQLQINLQRIELAQLRAQAAQVEFDRASDDLRKLLQVLSKDGYDLDLQRLDYVEKPKSTKKD